MAIVWSTALDQHGPHQAIPDTPVCRGLTARVGDLDVIEWDNGLTKSGPSWGAALTQGVQHATPASREAIARKVASDSASYSDMVSRLNPAQRADFDWLRGILTHPTRKWNEPDPQRTLAAIETVASLESDCGIMP